MHIITFTYIIQSNPTYSYYIHWFALCIRRSRFDNTFYYYYYDTRKWRQQHVMMVNCVAATHIRHIHRRSISILCFILFFTPHISHLSPVHKTIRAKQMASIWSNASNGKPIFILLRIHTFSHARLHHHGHDWHINADELRDLKSHSFPIQSAQPRCWTCIEIEMTPQRREHRILTSIRPIPSRMNGSLNFWFVLILLKFALTNTHTSSSSASACCMHTIFIEWKQWLYWFWFYWFAPYVMRRLSVFRRMWILLAGTMLTALRWATCLTKRQLNEFT